MPTREKKGKTVAQSAKKKPAKRSKVSAKKTAKAAAMPVTPSVLPGNVDLLKQVWSIFKANWRLLVGIVAVYLVLNILFASGLSNLSSAVANIKANFNGQAGQAHTFAKGLSGFGLLVASAGSSGSASASILQSGLFIIESLVIIWALRQIMAGKIISVKEAYYHSMFPLIPFLLVILTIFIQLLPLSFGALIVSAVSTSAAADVGLAVVFAWLIFILLAAWSIYMVSASIFAVYIVTLPEMHPREALRSARNLVKNRRTKIIPKLLFLPLVLLLVIAILIIPLIILAPGVVAPVFYVLSMLAILFGHSYLYNLYRSLLA